MPTFGPIQESSEMLDGDGGNFDVLKYSVQGNVISVVVTLTSSKESQVNGPATRVEQLLDDPLRVYGDSATPVAFSKALTKTNDRFWGAHGSKLYRMLNADLGLNRLQRLSITANDRQTVRYQISDHAGVDEEMKERAERCLEFVISMSTIHSMGL